MTKTLRIVGAEPIYATAGFFEDGTLGELFVFSRSGDPLAAALDQMAICISIGLQSGIPAETFTSKLRGVRSEPAGFTGDPDYPQVSSHFDYLARWLERLTANGSQA